jgi:hypothetical protein
MSLQIISDTLSQIENNVELVLDHVDLLNSD